jgi:hypothetical protein
LTDQRQEKPPEGSIK